jgi:peptidyl-prolyl cis-trans isomerase C
MPFEVVRDRIADMLEARSWSIEAARYVADLATRNEIEGIRIEGSN